MDMLPGNGKQILECYVTSWYLGTKMEFWPKKKYKDGLNQIKTLY
jgi:hypothetical protein